MNQKALAVLVLFCMSAAVPSSGAVTAPEKVAAGQTTIRKIAKKTPQPPDGEENLMVEVSAKYLELEGKTRFLAGNGTQVNYVTGGDRPVVIKNSQGDGVEYKKVGFILNVLPVLAPDDDSRASIQLQTELSGPTQGVQAGGNEVPGIATWQWQSSFTVELGKKTVLVDGPAHLELTVTRAD